MKRVIICGIITVLCIIATVFLGKNMDTVELDYTEVKAMVVSAESKDKTIRVGKNKTQMTVHEVVVRYEGEKYDLKNAHDTYSYTEGQMITAYLYHGKLYANIEGVRTSTPQGIAYFVALFSSFGMFIVTLVMLSKIGQRKKEALL